jgi:hypothetical protein
MKVGSASLSFAVAVVTFLVASVVNASCENGRESCLPNYVWRQAFPGDHVCVPKASHDAARDDNARASDRRLAGGGAYGPDTCVAGYVWREASPTDHVCVPGDVRERTSKENALANDRLDASCASPPVTHSSVDAAIGLLQTRAHVAAALTMFGIALLVLIFITNPLATAYASHGVAPKAVGSLIYAVMVWAWPVLCALPDYFMNEKGNPVYRIQLYRLIGELCFDPRVAIGMAAFCLAAIVLGKSGLTQIRGSAGRLRGAATAQAGRALGYVALIPLVIGWALFGFLLMTLSGLAH